jgi:hypothetical protein
LNASRRRQPIAIVRTYSVPTARNVMLDRGISADDAVVQMRRAVRVNLLENLGGLSVPMPEVCIVDRYLFSDQAEVHAYDSNDPIVLALSRAEKTDEVRLIEFLAEINRSEALPSGAAAGRGRGSRPAERHLSFGQLCR